MHPVGADGRVRISIANNEFEQSRPTPGVITIVANELFYPGSQIAAVIIVSIDECDTNIRLGHSSSFSLPKFDLGKTPVGFDVQHHQPAAFLVHVR